VNRPLQDLLGAAISSPFNRGADRSFLFLQGPPGPLFREVGLALRGHGFPVHRINLSGGDLRDWPDAALNFRGRFAEWPLRMGSRKLGACGRTFLRRVTFGRTG
jgi:hypothetical protein